MPRARRVRTQAESTRGFRTNSQAPRENLLKGKPLNQCMIGIDMATQKNWSSRSEGDEAFFILFILSSSVTDNESGQIFDISHGPCLRRA